MFNNEVFPVPEGAIIPTNSEFQSLNLSHSLIIIAQYISNLLSKSIFKPKKTKKFKAASKKEILAMTNLCIK